MSHDLQHVWTVLCHKGIVDSKTQTLSMIEVLETVNVKLKKAKPQEILKIPFQTQIISFWAKPDGVEEDVSTDVKIIIYAPENRKIGEIAVSININAAKKFARSIIDLQFLPITVSGEYILEVQQKKNKKYQVQARIPFLVNIEFESKEIPQEV